MSMPCGSPSLSDMPLGSSGGRRPASHRYISTKVLLAEGGDTPFAEHCRNYENCYRVRAKVACKSQFTVVVVVVVAAAVVLGVPAKKTCSLELLVFSHSRAVDTVL